MTDREFLVLFRDKIDLLIPRVSINAPLVEVSAMITGRLEELETENPPRRLKCLTDSGVDKMTELQGPTLFAGVYERSSPGLRAAP
jgi:hypothetical protein